jgi:hypothetical protein
MCPAIYRFPYLTLLYCKAVVAEATYANEDVYVS